MSVYHGIVVKEGFKDEKILNSFKIIGSKQGRDLFDIKIEVPEKEVKDTINRIQKNLKENRFYAHLYRDNELIVIFPQKIFIITIEKKTWKETIDYGLSLGIPERQLDFKPCRFEDENY